MKFKNFGALVSILFFVVLGSYYIYIGPESSLFVSFIGFVFICCALYISLNYQKEDRIEKVKNKVKIK